MTRDEARKRLKMILEEATEYENAVCYVTSDDADALDMAIKALEKEPKIGRWIKTPKAVMGEGYMWFCDKCEHQVYQDSSRPYPSENYCPNCGAKMEVEN